MHLIPALQKEVNWSRGATKTGRDNFKYLFKNGSIIDILPARESSRGQRRTGGLLEEIILIEEEPLNEIIIPTMNVDRVLPDGTTDPYEIVNQSQIAITSAGYQGTFAYEKMIEFMLNSIMFPDEYFNFGGGYELAILEGSLKQSMLDELLANDTYSEESFNREMGSVWTGEPEDAYFSFKNFDKNRSITKPEEKRAQRLGPKTFYIISVDVGRTNCNTEASIIRCTPSPGGDITTHLVNIYSKEAEHFEDQSIWIKNLYYAFKARAVVVDAQGLNTSPLYWKRYRLKNFLNCWKAKGF